MFLVTSSEDSEDSLLGLSHWKTHVLFRFICFIYVYECTPVCIYVHHAVPGTPGGQKRGSFPLVTGVTDGYELPYGCWEVNLGPLQEKKGVPNCRAISPAP